MLAQFQSLLIYGILVSFYLYNEKCVESTSEFVGIVRNLSVNVLQDQKYTERQDAYKFLKLNISWLPPNSIRQPSSYSIIVTGMSIGKKTSTTECPEGLLFYTLMGNKKFHVLLPEYNNSIDIPDLHIQPNCSYKVQVLANPRASKIVNAPEVLYTVPECIDHTCTCINAKTMLPIPKVNITQRENQLVINWSTTLNTSNVQFYAISIGVPLLLSRKGLTIYNITKIGQVPADKTTFIWNLKSNSQYAEVKDAYKMIVNAVDYQGCSGAEGFVIHSTSLSTQNTETVNHNTWFIVIGIISSCILFGVLSFILYRTHFFMINQDNSSIRKRTISKCKAQWTETILQKYNILYIKHEPEEEYIEETDRLKVPFKSVKLICNLGTGQFGKVYLGHLDDINNTLVAVKMSQQTDISVDSETRQQFINEIEIMKMAGNHPHLVSLIGYCIKPTNPICILLEYMQGGDLLTYLHHQRKQEIEKVACQDKPPDASETFYTNIYSTTSNKTYSTKFRQYANISDNCRKEANSEKESWIGKMKGHQFLKFATQIAMGMEHLESKKITHRDLAARNILLSADLTLKISDFGLSCDSAYVKTNTEGKTRHLPIRWMSPEALYNRTFSSKSDVWSFGVVLWEISTLGGFPYSNVQDDHLLRYVVHENGRLEQPDNVPLNIYKLMHSCWTTEPENRPNFTQLVSELRTLTASLKDTFCAISNPCYALSFSNRIP